MRLGVDAVVDGGVRRPGDVEVVDDRVVAVGLSPAGTGLIAARGYVDLQVNGFAGVDLLAADEDAVRAAARAQAATGVQAWQPTLITADETDTRRALRTLTAVAAEGGTAGRGGGILGVHLEGPFLSSEKLGTHPAEHRRDPDPARLDRLLAAGPVTYVTLAPELPGALDLVRMLVARGIVVSLGHSAADAAAAHAGFDAGARTVTHLFNAMTPFTPRRPGLAGAALSRDDVVVQVIVDGHHLAPETVRLAFLAARGRVALVTDAIAAAGRGDGTYRLGDVEVTVADDAVRRADGTLAGSALTMPEAVANTVALGVPLPEAVAAATVVPATLVGRPELAALRPGAPADLVVLDDAGRLHRTLAAGQEPSAA
ncbi:N-acetylglucosamine-6-phosphate deacetylase [Egicoccus halophilus]|uniref:N-acetylglucosamine-6-phosphate deacetylase n=1 Tax=Egicoccus halophilus TaxID=1670830 RepID=A0A8J3ACA6_9ACTN|nr:N-acetylglucosamine-6-phosphate deacetylase [Egicoccus halophilus]GGI08420.1 N-acetylglucosamine-6-phosphate deacetylase [Egicoccus halophilus]